MKLVEFAKWVLENGPIEGCDLDGGTVQEKAFKCGLLEKQPYAPDVHGSLGANMDFVEPGDTIYVFTDEFKSAISKEP